MQLRLLTLNVWALPWPVSRDTSTRLRAISRKLPEIEADVVAFQEVWTRGAAAALLEGGRGAGYSNTWHIETR